MDVRAFAPFALIAAVSACNAGSSGNDLSGAAPGSGGSSSGGNAGIILGAGTSATGAGGQGQGGGGISIQPTGTGSVGDDCGGGIGADIFVVSSKDELVRYSPQSGTFTLINKLSCPTSGDNHPFSMAVSREGTAFVLYESGDMFLVSTADASCQASSFKSGQHGFTTFGMGFVSDTVGGSTETLFIIDGRSESDPTATNHGLAYIPLDTGAVTPVADFPKPYSGRPAEVTGTGNAQLFAFFVDGSSASVAEIDKSTANVISNQAQDLPKVLAFAFAHWGGSFYLFNGNNKNNSRVDKYTPGMGTTNVTMDAGYIIVGAGVSTCAPVTPPIE